MRVKVKVGDFFFLSTWRLIYIYTHTYIHIFFFSLDINPQKNSLMHAGH